MYFLNPPGAMSTIMSLLKPVLTEAQRAKIVVLDKATDLVKKNFHPNQLERQFGGVRENLVGGFYPVRLPCGPFVSDSPEQESISLKKTASKRRGKSAEQRGDFEASGALDGGQQERASSSGDGSARGAGSVPVSARGSLGANPLEQAGGSTSSTAGAGGLEARSPGERPPLRNLAKLMTRRTAEGRSCAAIAGEESGGAPDGGDHVPQIQWRQPYADKVFAKLAEKGYELRGVGYQKGVLREDGGQDDVRHIRQAEEWVDSISDADYNGCADYKWENLEPDEGGIVRFCVTKLHNRSHHDYVILHIFKMWFL